MAVIAQQALLPSSSQTISVPRWHSPTVCICRRGHEQAAQATDRPPFRPMQMCALPAQ